MPSRPYPPPAEPSRGRVLGAALTSRGAGWALAALLAGAVIALSILLANSPGPGPGRVARGAPGPGGTVVVGPGKIQALVPRLTGPARVRFQISAGGLPPRIISPVPGPGPGVVLPGPGQGGGQFMTPLGEVVTGTVSSVSGSRITLATIPGQTVTVTEQASTVYRKDGNPAAASDVTKGARIWVLGSGSGTAISAAVVAVLS